MAIAPLDEPEKYKEVYEESLVNPIYQNIKQIIQFDYKGNYSLRNDQGIVMVYLRMEYSNTKEGELYEPEETWMAVTIRFDIGELQFTTPEEEWIETHRPYVQQLLELGAENE